MYQAAPNTIFCVAAGNDSADIDQILDYPSRVFAYNKIVVAATNGYSSIANFSNFGGKSVDVAAPGVAIYSTAPTNTYISLSGTSQAAPFVTNTIAQLKDINENLSIADVKSIIFETVDYKPWLKGKVRTSGIVNKDRAKKAAIYSKVMNVTLAIAKAKLEVMDVAVPKSLNNEPLIKLDIGYKPSRQSLLTKALN
jgi:subtilisin family serine protease